MHSYLRAVGFSHLKNRKTLEEVYRHTLTTPNRKIMTMTSVDTSLIQFEKDFGDRIGLALLGEYDINGSLSIEHYYPYIKGEHFMQFENIAIEKQTDKESYAGVCEDYRLGMTIIFYVLNIADYAKSKWMNYSNRGFTRVKLSGLSISGTILLGMHHSKKQAAVETDSRVKRMNLIEAAKGGDTEAMEKLTIDEMNTYSMISIRAHTEDIFSIVDSSLMPCGVECDHYMVIGNIKKVTPIHNTYSDELVYELLLEANGLYMNVCINEKDLQGEPLEGRRFRGEVWLQGVVQI